MRNQNNPFRTPPRLAPFKGVQNVTQSNLHSLQNGLLDNQVVQVGGLKYPLPVTSQKYMWEVQIIDI